MYTTLAKDKKLKLIVYMLLLGVMRNLDVSQRFHYTPYERKVDVETDWMCVQYDISFT